MLSKPKLPPILSLNPLVRCCQAVSGDVRQAALEDFRKEISILKACRDLNIVQFVVSWRTEGEGEGHVGTAQYLQSWARCRLLGPRTELREFVPLAARPLSLTKWPEP